jgi:hypothetical protein
MNEEGNKEREKNENGDARVENSPRSGEGRQVINYSKYPKD